MLKKIAGLVLPLLEQHPSGLTEYELLQLISTSSGNGRQMDGATDNYLLFQRHFSLFHVLYQLRDQLLEQRAACLHISALKIVLSPYVDGTSGLSETDPLREYYLDATNLEQTSSDDVDHMLAEFWIGFVSRDQRQQALAELGLEDPVDDETIKDCYRRLAMKHHPDRGGDKERLQVINEAMAKLARAR